MGPIIFLTASTLTHWRQDLILDHKQKMEARPGEGQRMLLTAMSWLPHYTENPVYVFPEKELRGLSPNSYIHVFVSDLYIPRICPHIWLQLEIYKIFYRYMSEGIGRQNIINSVLEIRRLHNFISWNT